MIAVRTFNFNLHPTPEQAEKFSAFAGVTRLVYNLALEQRRDFWRQYLRAEGRHISVASQCREVTALRAEFDWISAIHSDVLTAALRDLDKAYCGFFAKRNGYPTPRRRGLSDSFRFRGTYVRTRKLNAKWGEIRIPGIGWVKYRASRTMPAEIRTLTIARIAGSWCLSAACRVELMHDAVAGAVGVDRGVTVTVALSTGEMFAVPKSLSAIEKRRRRAQRVLARRKRGSNRYRVQRAKVAALAAKQGRIRQDFHHRLTSGLAARFGTVAIEDLKITNMTASAAGTVAALGSRVARKSGLNRAILNQGWGLFEAFMSYKLEARGGHLIKVNPAYTSQTCSDCGTIDKASRESQARFTCVACGHQENADINAAKNILRASGSWLDVEGQTIGPVKRQLEALTCAENRAIGDVDSQREVDVRANPHQQEDKANG